MANTIACFHCHRNVSDDVESCPYCKKNPHSPPQEQDDPERRGPRYLIHWKPISKDQAAMPADETKDIERLIHDLTTGSPQIRENAMEIILSQSKDYSQHLIDALNAADSMGREHIVKALGRIGPRSSIQHLAKALASSDKTLKLSAAWALYRIGDLRVLPPFLETLKDRDSFIRRYIVYVLGGMNDRRSVPYLFKMLKDSSPEVRIQAVLSLASLEGKNAADAIRDLRRDTDPLVQKTAIEAIRVLGASHFNYWPMVYAGTALFLVFFGIVLAHLLSR
ncbi:MAG: HEAT repeat domain-containing protein [Elusimicrobia bacterium]|nr:HEAT repeat domain-containing protein [Elusimicrobiota bacterium]